MLKAPVTEPASEGKGSVLVVDDEEIVRNTCRLIVERAGFRVVLAHSGEQAVRILQDPSAPAVNLILLDMSMPGMNGKDVMAKLRELRIELPVLICSGYSEAEVHREFAGFGIAGCIAKPFTPHQLTSGIRNALQPGPVPGS